MKSNFIEQSNTVTKPLPSLAKLTKIQKRITRLDERQAKLDAARAKATKDLADEQRTETIQSGRAEFLEAMEALDLTAREMIISNVLQAIEDPSRRNSIHAWIATIPAPTPRPDRTEKGDQAETSSGPKGGPTTEQAETGSVEEKPPVADSPPEK